MAIFGELPSQYYSRRDARKDNKFRDIINLFLQLKQSKTQREQFGISKDLQSRGLDIQEQRAEYMKPYYRGRAEEMAADPDPTARQRDIDRLISEGVVKDYAEGEEFLRKTGIMTPEEARERGYASTAGAAEARQDFPTRVRPDVYDKRKADLQALVDTGKITPEQMTAALHGIGAKLEDPGDDDSKRNSNATQYRIWKENTFAYGDKDGAKEMKKEATRIYKRTGNAPTVAGFRIDMPTDYNLGLHKTRDGIATDHDRSVVAKYNAQFDAWQKLKDGVDIKDKDGKVVGRVELKNFKEFMAYISNPRNGVTKGTWDRDRVRIWYDIYKSTKQYK